MSKLTYKQLKIKLDSQDREIKRLNKSNHEEVAPDDMSNSCGQCGIIAGVSMQDIIFIGIMLLAWIPFINIIASIQK